MTMNVVVFFCSSELFVVANFDFSIDNDGNLARENLSRINRHEIRAKSDVFNLYYREFSDMIFDIKIKFSI